MNSLAHQIVTSCSCNAVSPKFYLLAVFIGLFQLPADAAALVLLQSGDVFGDTALFLWCVIGSSGGAYMAVFCFPPAESKIETTEARQMQFMIRKLCAKFGFSLVAGTLLSPLLMRLLSIPTDRTYVVGCSTLVSFAVAAAIHLGANLIDSWKASRRIVYITNNGTVNQLGGNIDNEQ